MSVLGSAEKSLKEVQYHIKWASEWVIRLGDGTDMHPCIISFSSRALLSVVPTLNTCLVPVVFHMDSTFKCNENEFPVTLLGVSDAQHQFHLLSISIVLS